MYWVTGILGMALVFAPFVLNYSENSAALWTSILLGLATMIVSWVEGAQGNRERWEYWTAGFLGLVAIAAPFLFGFSTHTAAMWTSVVTGTLIALLAGTRLTFGQWKI